MSPEVVLLFKVVDGLLLLFQRIPGMQQSSSELSAKLDVFRDESRKPTAAEYRALSDETEQLLERLRLGKD